MGVEILATTGFSIDIKNPGGWDTTEPVHQVDKSNGSFFAVSAQLTQIQTVNRGEIIVELLDANNNVAATARLSVSTIPGVHFLSLISLFPGTTESITETSVAVGTAKGFAGQIVRGRIVPGTAKWQNASIRCSMHGLYATDKNTVGYRMYVHTETLTVKPPPPSQAQLSLLFKGQGSLTWTQTFSFKA